MTPTTRRSVALSLLLAAAVALAACGSGPSRGRMATPKPLLPENYPKNNLTHRLVCQCTMLQARMPTRVMLMCVCVRPKDPTS